MQLRNLFTSNSDQSASVDNPLTKVLTSKRARTCAQATLGFVATLVAIDVAINRLFPYPTDPLNTSPSSLSLYFDYGRSIEGKIRRQMGPTNDTSAPIAQAGWLNAQNLEEQPTVPEPGDDILVASYGMSFSLRVMGEVEKLDPRITLRSMAGPAAPPNFSYSAYQFDRGKHEANVVVLGILASSVKGLDAMTGMTWGAEVPAPYTFPKYKAEAGQLQAIQPQIQSLEQLRQAMQNPQQWDAFVNQLETNDRFFNSFTFEQNVLDHSALFRLLRRAWAKSYQDNRTAQIHTSDGFNKKWEQTAVLKQMVQDFATTAKQDGIMPVVLLINDRGYDDHLYQLLRPTLERHSIPFVSTHDIAPATDQKNFIADGHFIPEADQKIAAKVLELINTTLGRSPAPTPASPPP